MTNPQKRRSPGGNRGNKSNNNQHGNDIDSQRRLLLAALQRGPVSTLDARERYGVMHPAARVQELRDRGHRIVTVWTDQHDTAGQRHRVAQYVLTVAQRPASGAAG